MILQPLSASFDSNDTQSYISASKLIKLLEKRNHFKDDLLKIFQIDDNANHVIQIGNSSHLIGALLLLDDQGFKVDIDVLMKDILLIRIIEAEKAEFQIRNIENDYILNDRGVPFLVAESAYSAKSDLLDYFHFSKFANYCKNHDYEDLLQTITTYLDEKNAENQDLKSLRLLHRYEDNRFFIRALTSVAGYRDFGINFSVFVALATLDEYVKSTQNEIYINKYRVDDSHLYISFALSKEEKVNDEISLSFNLVLENDEIKRSSVAFNGVFRLKWKSHGDEKELYMRPIGIQKKDKSHPVDLLTYQHRGNVEGVFQKIKELPNLIDFFIDQVSNDAKKIADINHPNDVKTFIKDKVRNARKAEFQGYKQAIINKLANIDVTNTFALFDLLREVEDLFEHDDIVAINFWRTKLYESLISRK